MDLPVRPLQTSHSRFPGDTGHASEASIEAPLRTCPPLLKRVLVQAARALGQLLLLWCGALAAALILAPGSSRADMLDPAMQAQLRAHVEQAMRAHPVIRSAAENKVTTRVHVEIGAIDPRLHLAPCAKVEPYVPAGVKLGGASRMGLRCLAGSTLWNISVPVRVQVFGRGLVALNTVQAGATLSAQDVGMGEVDLVAENSPALQEAQAVEGRTAARSLSVGQSVRQSHLKLRQWFAAGDVVRVVAAGPGFAVTSEGQALTPGIEGQPARVRTETGRVVSGTAVAHRQLALEL